MGRDSDCNLCLLQLDLAGNAHPSRRPPSFHDEAPAEAPGARPHVCEPVPPFGVIVGKPDAVVGHRESSTWDDFCAIRYTFE